MNDAPVARQSRGTARPQAGESTFPHQIPITRQGGRYFSLVESNKLDNKCKLNKNLVKKFDTSKYVGYDEKNNWGGACV